MAGTSLLRRRSEALDGGSLQVITRALASKLREGLHLSEPFIQSNVDDLVGQALLEYERKRDSGEKIANPGGFIVHTGFCRAIDQLRREGREVHGEAAELALELTEDPGAGTDTEAMSRVETARLYEAIGTLKESERQALSAAFYNDESTQSAARLLGMSETTFRRRRDDAIRKLRKRFVVPEQLDPRDPIAVDLGLAAHLSLAAGATASVGLFHWVTGLIERGRDLAMRVFLGGGADGVSGAAGQSAVKAVGLGICGASATAAVCVVAGVAPGINLPGLGSHSDEAAAHRAIKRPSVATPMSGVIESQAPPKSRPPSRARSNRLGAKHARAVRRRHHKGKVSHQPPSLGLESAVPDPTPVPIPSPPPAESSGGRPSPDEIAEEQFGP